MYNSIPFTTRSKIVPIIATYFGKLLSLPNAPKNIIIIPSKAVKIIAFILFIFCRPKRLFYLLFNYKKSQDRGIEFYIKGLPRRFENLLQISSGGDKGLEKHYLISEAEIIGHADSKTVTAYGRLLHGVIQYYRQQKLHDKRLYDFIAKKQTPHTLFITCSDSRIIPAYITSSDPGELFIIRNVGNYIPPYNPKVKTGEAAAIEFAVLVLNVSDVVICGHANCGAMKACCELHQEQLPPNLQAWIETLSKDLVLDERLNVEEITKVNVINQLNHLYNYPLIKQRVDEGSLHLHGWFFNFNESRVYEWKPELKLFTPVEGTVARPVMTPSVN